MSQEGGEMIRLPAVHDNVKGYGYGISNNYLVQLTDVESVKVHNLFPGRNKILQELLPGVLRPINLRQGPELGV